MRDAGRDARHWLDLRRPLRFDPPLEAAFRDAYYDEALLTNRVSFAFGLAILAGFGVVDVWAAPQSMATVWAIRFAIACPAVVALLALSFSPAYRRLMQPLSAFVAWLVGTCVAAMALVQSPDEPGYDLYIFGVAPVLVFTFIAPRLRFWYAAAAGWGLVASSLLIGLARGVAGDSHLAVDFVVSESFILAVAVIGMMGARFIEASTRHAYLQQVMLAGERERAEALLRHILPGPVAERLKRGERVVDRFEAVSILFADIVDFAPLAATLTPDALVALLNDAFSAFDGIAERHRLEKIKTIGDAYMAASGVPVPEADHACRVAEAALGMLAAMEALAAAHGHHLRLRIGINSGPVVAGIIGLQKFSYDLWGDAVNTASRMESHGAPGRIHVAPAAYELLRHRYAFDGPEEVLVKGMGPMHTWFLTGRRTVTAPTVTAPRCPNRPEF